MSILIYSCHFYKSSDLLKLFNLSEWDLLEQLWRLLKLYEHFQDFLEETGTILEVFSVYA